jgi:hypothetical protein
LNASHMYAVFNVVVDCPANQFRTSTTIGYRAIQDC